MGTVNKERNKKVILQKCKEDFYISCNKSSNYINKNELKGKVDRICL